MSWTFYAPPHVSRQVWWGYLAGKLFKKPKQERPWLVGIRGLMLWAQEPHPTRHRQAYDDTFVWLPKDGSVQLFPGSTHAYQLYSKLSPDVNGDGVGDVGTIDPGLYVLHALQSKFQMFELTMPDGGKLIPCTRDTNHDGVPEADRHYKASGILFHTGFDAPAGAEHRSSIGCQTCSLEYLRMMRAAGETIDYALASAEAVSAIMEGFDDGAHDTDPSELAPESVA